MRRTKEGHEELGLLARICELLIGRPDHRTGYTAFDDLLVKLGIDTTSQTIRDRPLDCRADRVGYTDTPANMASIPPPEAASSSSSTSAWANKYRGVCVPFNEDL